MQPKKYDKQFLRYATGNFQKRSKLSALPFVFSLLGMILCALSFALIGFIGGFVYEINLFPWIILPFPVMIVCIVLMVFTSLRMGFFRFLKLIVTTVNSRDSILVCLFTRYGLSEQGALDVVRALMAGGAMPGYSLVADVMLVKDGTEMSEAEAKKEYEEYKKLLAMNVKYSPVGIPTGISPTLFASASTTAPTSKEETAVAENRCARCGEKLTEGANFCPKCGSRTDRFEG